MFQPKIPILQVPNSDGTREPPPALAAGHAGDRLGRGLQLDDPAGLRVVPGQVSLSHRDRHLADLRMDETAEDQRVPEARAHARPGRPGLVGPTERPTGGGEHPGERPIPSSYLGRYDGRMEYQGTGSGAMPPLRLRTQPPECDAALREDPRDDAEGLDLSSAKLKYHEG